MTNQIKQFIEEGEKEKNRTTSENMMEFAKDLTSLINKHCIENETNTPDFILSDYLMNCLEAYHSLNIKKEVWKKN